MKYLCLICAETVMEHMPEADRRQHFREYERFTQSIKRDGHFIGANRLQPADRASTVRVRDGKVSVTDGPFAETKEQFGGYYLIEARDMDAAIQDRRANPRRTLWLRRGSPCRRRCADHGART